MGRAVVALCVRPDTTLQFRWKGGHLLSLPRFLLAVLSLVVFPAVSPGSGAVKAVREQGVCLQFESVRDR